MLGQPILATVLSWAGIIGGTLTVFSSLDALIKLSGWARWLASRWQEWMTTLWGSYLGLSSITTDPDMVLIDFPFFTSLVLIAISSSFMKDNTQAVSARRALVSLSAGTLVLVVIFTIVVLMWRSGYAPGSSTVGIALIFAGYWVVTFLVVSHWPYRLAVATADLRPALSSRFG